MMKNIKNQKGITLVSLTITVIILILITGIIIYNASDSIYIRNYSYLENDIQNLKNKISNFYNEYGNIPAKAQVTRISSGIQTVFNDIEKQNLGEFYVVDLQVFDGLTLHYGKDYEKVKNDNIVSEYYPDLYVINKVTHNVFLLGGIKAKEGNEIKTYYTNYSTPNNTLVDFRYIDGIRIPDGYYYIGRNDENKIVISTSQTDVIDDNSNIQYVWEPTTIVPDNINFVEGQIQYELELSIQVYNGYYYNPNTNTVIYLRVETLEPGETATSSKFIYKSDNKIAKIPEGFKVSDKEDETSINGGLVIYAPDNSEYVWIPVDGILGEDGEIADVTGSEKKILLGRYDFGRNGTPLVYSESYTEDTQASHNSNYGNKIATDIEAFIQSVRDNHGYYIARYEAGVENGELDTSEMLDENAAPNTEWTGYKGENIKLVSKEGKQVWNYVTQRKASILCQNLYSGVNSDLVNSYAWGTAILYIQKYSGDSDYSRQIRIQTTLAKTGEATDGTNNDVRCNIYDMAGNCFEWTTETSSNSYAPCLYIGGVYYSSTYYTSTRSNTSTTIAGDFNSFRPLLYL